VTVARYRQEQKGNVLKVCESTPRSDRRERSLGFGADALDRLALHYGFTARVKGRAQAAIRTWLAEGEAFSVEGSLGAYP